MGQVGGHGDGNSAVILMCCLWSAAMRVRHGALAKERLTGGVEVGRQQYYSDIKNIIRVCGGRVIAS